MGRADGIHWRTGSAPAGRDGPTDPILDVLQLDAPTIMNEPEAQWYWLAVVARRAEYAASVGYAPGLTVWRSSPQEKPALSGWNAHSYSRSVFANLDAHHDRTGAYPSDVLLLNELNLNYERGDEHDDMQASNWPSNYRYWADFLVGLLGACRERAADRGWSPRWWFPAWAPGHGELRDDIAPLWTSAAEMFDGVCLHAYNSVESVTQTVEWYARAFPRHPLLLGEWNAPGSLAEEGQIRQRLMTLCAGISRLQTCYFIWRWEQDAGQRTYDIEGNPDRMALWDGAIVLHADPTYMVPGDIADAPQVPRDGQQTPPAPPVATGPTQPDPGPSGPSTEVPMADERVYGVDVSNWQVAAIDWAAVAASGRAFGVCKASEGTSFVDPDFDVNWRGIADANMVRIAYHFARPSANQPDEEAAFFLSVVNANGGFSPGDGVWLDMEDTALTSGMDLTAWVYTWGAYIAAAEGFWPVVYTGKWYADPHGFGDDPGDDKLTVMGLCIAAYEQPPMPDYPRGDPPAPVDPWLATGAPLAFWQYSSSGRVPGIAGDCDLDAFFGNLDQLRKYGKPGPAPAPTPQPETTYNVGSGLVDAMAARGDRPASDEVFSFQGSTANGYSTAIGTDGLGHARRYTWVPSLSRAFWEDLTS